MTKTQSSKKPAETKIVMPVASFVLSLLGALMLAVFAFLTPVIALNGFVGAFFLPIGIAAGVLLLTALVLGIVGLIKSAKSKTSSGIVFAIIAIFIAAVSLVSTIFVVQNLVDAIDHPEKASQEKRQKENERTQKILANDADVTIGSAVIAADGKSGYLPVTVKNKTNQPKNFLVEIKAVTVDYTDYDVTDEVYTGVLNPQETFSENLFEVKLRETQYPSSVKSFEETRLEMLQTAKFEVKSIK